MANSLDVAAITGYVEERRLPILRKMVLSPKSTKLFTLQTGVKKNSKINLLDTTVVFGDGGNCGFNASGTSAFTQRQISAGDINVQFDWCDKKLLGTWGEYEVKVAANKINSDVPFAEYLLAGVSEKVGKELEKAIWQGDTTSETENLNKFDGLLKIIDAASASVASYTTAAASATVYDRTMAVYNAIPDDVLEESVIYMSYSNFRALAAALTDKNLFHYEHEVNGDMEMYVPNTNTKIIGVPGLVGKDYIIAMPPQHTFYGVDMEGDFEDAKLWYSQDNQSYRLNIDFVAGVQIAFPSEVVVNKKA